MTLLMEELLGLDGNLVPVEVVNGQRYYHGTYICGALGIKNVCIASRKLARDQKRIVRFFNGVRNARAWYFTESGIYSLLIQSRTPKGQHARNQMCREFLPGFARARQGAHPLEV